MKFAWIQTEKASYPLTKLCRWLGVTPSGFYAWRQRPESTHAREDRRLKVLVQASFAESKQRYGSPRIHEDLIEQDEQVSRKRVIRLMQEDGLKARTRKRFTVTTMSDHDQPVAANLLDRQFEAAAPNQRWVGDTTECVIGSSGTLYLAVVLDLFSRCVVGWAVSAVNDRHLTIKALEMALKRRCPEIGLLHHSDQGCTYASADYQALLDGRGIVCSMSRRGNCHDNAVMESFFSTVKSELTDRFDTYGDAKMEMFDYIEVFYNQRRRHSTLGQISPAAFERRANEEGVEPMENRQGRGFPQAPHPLSFSMRKEQTTREERSTQRNRPLNRIMAREEGNVKVAWGYPFNRTNISWGGGSPSCRHALSEVRGRIPGLVPHRCRLRGLPRVAAVARWLRLRGVRPRRRAAAG